MGTLGEENGPDIAIKAMTLVIRNFPDAVLHIVGGGDYEMDRLKSLVSKLKHNKLRSIIFQCFSVVYPQAHLRIQIRYKNQYVRCS